MSLIAQNVRYAAQGAQGRLEILRGVDVAARSGELLGLCGANGAGKSTLLRALGGLIPVAGDILLFGEPLGALATRCLARRIAYMHQDTQMPFGFTAREVVAMGRYPYRGAFGGFSSADAEAVDSALALAACAEHGEKRMTQLSGGERQRVMLARALAQDTPVLLLDEPASSQDARLAHLVFALAARLAGQGKLVIAVAHDLRVAAAYCDRILLLAQGEVVDAGTPRQTLTEANLARAFSMRARVFDNPAGQWDYYLEE